MMSPEATLFSFVAVSTATFAGWFSFGLFVSDENQWKLGCAAMIVPLYVVTYALSAGPVFFALDVSVVSFAVATGVMGAQCIHTLPKEVEVVVGKLLLAIAAPIVAFHFLVVLLG
jgi:outer membrane scaffolding protein for murein synthesis (MipA/OmpV family)